MYTLIFDIGNTNKKAFLFDEALSIITQEQTTFPEVKDEDGFPCDDLSAITQWMQDTLDRYKTEYGSRLTTLNFSTYGATLVHLDQDGRPVTPLYNYLKPFPNDLWAEFYATYGPEERLSVETASPALGMLNSGLQLYWLKKHHSEQFARIRHTLHFPQYCSYLFSEQLTTEYTSIGCHTALWNYSARDYHDWVKKEDLVRLFPALQSSNTSFNKGGLKIGSGIHDSSAALLPYLLRDPEPFMLLSTGTWNICLNPFNAEPLTTAELQADCLNYLRIGGQPVKASRLFLGNMYEEMMEELKAKHSERKDYERAHAKLIEELVQMQVEAIRLAQGNTGIRRMYIDGGFVKNEAFVNGLQKALPDFEIIAAEVPNGSALGAALASGAT